MLKNLKLSQYQINYIIVQNMLSPQQDMIREIKQELQDELRIQWFEQTPKTKYMMNGNSDAWPHKKVDNQCWYKHTTVKDTACVCVFLNISL